MQGLCDGPCLQGQRELCGELCCLQTQKLARLRAVVLGILPAREMGPRELPLPRGWARCLSLIYGTMAYKVGLAHRSLGIVSNT